MTILTFELSDVEHEERFLHSFFYEEYDGDMFQAMVDGLRHSEVEELRQLATRAALHDDQDVAFLNRELEELAKSNVIDLYHSTTRIVIYEHRA